MSDKFEPTDKPADGVWGTVDGTPITDEVIEEVVENAEAGFPGTSFKPVGRPRTVGTNPAKTVTVRLDPERIAAVRARAERDHTNASEILRRALDQYLAS